MTSGAGRVTKITEYGDARLCEAIKQGLVADDVRRDFEAAVREKENAIRERDFYKTRCAELEAIKREDARRATEAYKARLDQRGLWLDLRGVAIVIGGMAAMVIIGIVSIAVGLFSV